MRLIEWMRAQGLDDETVAKMVGNCTAHAVKKWKYGERQPPADQAVRIERVTKGRVRVEDLLLVS